MENSANRDQSRVEVWSLARKAVLILVNTDRRTGITFRKIMPPGTISLISVPELEELPSVSLPPVRSARSRIPCSPKCPSFPLSAKQQALYAHFFARSKIRSNGFQTAVL